ncbi:HI_0552 family protein [uncultured Granulicatella sp.]|jgi:hypothetical protein|uniref:HI_0552 family protein n=1 Tax=uncultured Granulicatella sp. TaxID=316089 RepID=UPI00261F9A01|nr:HI_0552 family protein [uncultured Granulicatella sp.]
MITIEKMRHFFRYDKVKYRNPVKFPEVAEEMEQLKKAGQDARQEFTKLTEVFYKNFHTFSMDRVSQWMNQAQVLRPAFWRYFIEEGQDEGNPSFALRLFNEENKLGVYVELSFIERIKNDNSVRLQNKVLECEPNSNILYVASDFQKNAMVFEGNESNRDKLTRAVKEGEIRKVILRSPVFLESTKDGIEEELADALKELIPFYKAIYMSEVN